MDDRLFEIAPQVACVNGLYRIQWMVFGLDGMAHVAGPRTILTRHAALGLQAAITREIFSEFGAAEVLKLRA